VYLQATFKRQEIQENTMLVRCLLFAKSTISKWNFRSWKTQL